MFLNFAAHLMDLGDQGACSFFLAHCHKSVAWPSLVEGAGAQTRNRECLENSQLLNICSSLIVCGDTGFKLLALYQAKRIILKDRDDRG